MPLYKFDKARYYHSMQELSDKFIDKYCTARTQSGKRCPNKIHIDDELQLCHIHHPNMKFKQQHKK